MDDGSLTITLELSSRTCPILILDRFLTDRAIAATLQLKVGAGGARGRRRNHRTQQAELMFQYRKVVLSKSTMIPQVTLVSFFSGTTV